MTAETSARVRVVFNGVMDSLDIERPESLLAYLRASGRIGARERPQLSRLAGGVSNRTVLLERASGEAWVIKQGLERLRVEADWFSDPDRVVREGLGMRWLSRLTPAGAIPEFLFEDRRYHLLAMRAVPRPHETWKSILMRGVVRPPHLEQFGRLLGTIHRRGHEQRQQLARAFDDRSIFDSLRIEPYFRYSASRVPDAAGFLKSVVEEMEPRRLTLVHGDYSPKNVLVSQERFVLVDHETIHFGDPAFDLGFSLTHLLSKANHFVAWRGEFAAGAAVHWRAYRAALGDGPAWIDDLERRAVRLALACLIARITGRSPLEYLDDAARKRQLSAACTLAVDPPPTVQELIDQFVREL